jgi:branched-chain amino acid:cation transporter, LIVCS family
MNGQRLPLGKLLLMSGALFSMHFGSSSLIWPMTWGKESGSSVFIAFLGIALSAIIFPFLGYLALSKGEGTFYQISERVSTGFAKFFCSITILMLGPLFTIPRISASLWDSLTQVTGYKPINFIPSLVFSLIIYLIVYCFMANKLEIINRISKLLLPILLISICFIIFKGLSFPLSEWETKTYTSPAFIYGFINGYATIELPSALVIAAIMINDLKNKGVMGKEQEKNLIFIGFVGLSLLAVVHFCHMLLGSFTGGLFSELKYASLYARVVVELWGQVGGVIFNFTLLLAVLTSTIGFTSATAEYFSEVSRGRLPYKGLVIAILVISAVISSVGLSNIIVFTAPLLNMIYPATISLTLYYSLVPNLIENPAAISAMRYSVIVAFAWGIFEALIQYMEILNINMMLLRRIYESFPLSNYNLGWLPITLAAGFTGYLISRRFILKSAEVN